MEIYYLLAVICCLTPFIGGGIWFALRCDKESDEKSPVPSLTSKFSFEDYESIMIHYYSPYGGNSSLREKLENVNPLASNRRAINAWDHWFRRHTADCYHDGDCLAYINHYGYIEDTFWKNIDELGLKPEKDLKFQLLLISVYYNEYIEQYYKNFSNLLFNFGKHYQLMPEVQNILNNDQRFAQSKKTYEFARKCAA